MKGEQRKQAIAAYKERKIPAGIFAIRCPASGQVWVGATPNLEAIRNRLGFSLKTGKYPVKSLQAAWAAHGESAFVFEALERLDEESSDYLRRAALRARAVFWREKLNAEPA